MNFVTPALQIPKTEKITSFMTEVWIAGGTRIFNIGKDLVLHTEAVGVLVLASLGLNALMGELPFLFALPLWIEASMVIPVLSVLIISMLVKISTWRAARRSS